MRLNPGSDDDRGMTTSQNITATKTRKGNKFEYHVYFDGELREGYPMTSKVADYEYVLVQRWSPVGVSRLESDGRTDLGDPEQFAARFSRKPKDIGAKIEYGYCAQVVKIEEVL